MKLIKLLFFFFLIFLVFSCSTGNEIDNLTTDQAKTMIQEKGLKFDDVTFVSEKVQEDVELVKLFIKAGMPANTTHPSNWTPLHGAISGKENFEVLNVLVNSGADINSYGIFIKDKTPLGVAAREDENINSLNLLINAGADLNKYCGQYTPLMIAVSNGQAKSVKALIDAGADLNLLSKPTHGTGKTALGIALMIKESGQKIVTAKSPNIPEVIRLLKEAGARE